VLKIFKKPSSVSKAEQLYKQKRLLVGITLSEVGGSQKVVYDIISNLPENEYLITLVTSPNGELINWVSCLNVNRKLKIQIITLASLKRDISFSNDIKAFLNLLKIIYKGKFDIAHFHNSKIGVLGRIAAKILRVPKIYYTVHGWGINASKSAFQHTITCTLESIASRLCTKVICVSDHDLDKGINNGWIQQKKACVIHNGIAELHETKHELRRNLQVLDTIPVIATITRLSEPKDPIFTIKTAAQIKNEGFDFKLLIIGDGPFRKDCEVLIDSLKMRDCVLMMGTQYDVRGLLSCVDLVLLFSKWEGLPISIIEALFAGKPVVASNVGGIPELIEHGENGYLLDGFDILQAAEYIKRLMCDDSLRKMMGSCALKTAYSKYTLNEMVRKYQDVYSGT